MKYDKYGRQAIKQLSGSAQALFKVIEREEKGAIINVPGLCRALNDDPKFVAFSCLYGDGKRESLQNDLGMLFATSLGTKMEAFLGQLTAVGLKNPLLVIVDDTEPVKFWKWKTNQEEVTAWCDMVREESKIPEGWDVGLWSEVEMSCREVVHELPLYEQFYERQSRKAAQSVAYHNLFQHIKKFPNKGLKDVRVEDAVTGKMMQYQFECLVLNLLVPNLILIQTETPWEVKDPLFHNPLKNSPMNIIHPFQRWR